ncbi:hypothetical protein HY065_00395 [Candidatus Berkelbacteria bacterium]|nr:hypothetical protein [Candidatus Berkelbacteria bacterium]
MKKLVPAILTNNEQDFARKLNILEQLGVPEVQIDVIDGRFVNNTSIGIEVIEKYPTKMRREAHLMVVNPMAAAHEYLQHGFESVIIHYEALASFQDLYQFGRRPVGIAINPETPISSIVPIAQSVSQILIMGVRAGFAGQTFIPETLRRVKQLRQWVPTATIGVDGGIADDLIKQVFAAGADRVVFNCQRIVDAADPAEYWKKFKKLT